MPPPGMKPSPKVIAAMTDARLTNSPRRRPNLALERIQAFLDYRHLSASARSPAHLASFTRRYLRHQPLSLILGWQPFCGLEIRVRRPILSPRMETEYWVSGLLERFDFSGKRMLEVGTGSGCIALAIARRFPTAHITAIDVSRAAIDLSYQNQRRLGIENVEFRHESLESHHGHYDAIVSNPPYIPQSRLLPRSVRWYEDRRALYSGHDGLDMIRELLQARHRLLNSSPGLKLVFEFDGTRLQRRLLKSIEPNLVFERDQFRHFRTAILQTDVY